jgi:hypothetical protein
MIEMKALFKKIHNVATLQIIYSNSVSMLNIAPVLTTVSVTHAVDYKLHISMNIHKIQLVMFWYSRFHTPFLIKQQNNPQVFMLSWSQFSFYDQQLETCRKHGKGAN